MEAFLGYASGSGAQLGALDVLILLCMQLQGSWAVASYKRGFSTCQVWEHGRAGLLGQVFLRHVPYITCWSADHSHKRASSCSGTCRVSRAAAAV